MCQLVSLFTKAISRDDRLHGVTGITAVPIFREPAPHLLFQWTAVDEYCVFTRHI
jgi:hypothetical protein